MVYKIKGESYDLVHTYTLPNGINNHALVPIHKIQWLDQDKENFWLDHCFYLTDHELELNGAEAQEHSFH